MRGMRDREDRVRQGRGGGGRQPGVCNTRGCSVTHTEAAQNTLLTLAPGRREKAAVWESDGKGPQNKGSCLVCC